MARELGEALAHRCVDQLEEKRPADEFQLGHALLPLRVEASDVGNGLGVPQRNAERLGQLAEERQPLPLGVNMMV